VTSPLLDATEVARRLQVSRATAYREMRKMIHVVVGTRALRVAESSLEAYLRRHTETPASARAKSGDGDRHLRIVYPRTRPKEDAAS
jgi:predicted DNA-binding transcriptional regulator AlpA